MIGSIVGQILAVITLGAPFSDGVVLQREREVPVWGTARSGNTVEVAFDGQRVTAEVGGDCKWCVRLAPMKACRESRKLVVTERSGRSVVSVREIADVLVGEVWFASGQSNMECPIWGSNTRYRDMKGGLMTTMTHLPLVRYVKVGRAWSPRPIQRLATWNRFSRENLQLFYRVDTALGGKDTGVSLSAVAFYYARELYLALGVPIGIVDASWGGTNIDAWTPRCGYENCDPSLRGVAEYAVCDESSWSAQSGAKGPIYGPHQQPTVLWNGMIDAFAPMAMRGFIWYQGCHNSSEPELYAAKMHALYDGWKRAFRNPDLKLYFVELAPFSTSWLKLCAAQEKFADEEPNAAIAVTSDVGNFDDIHPNDKEIVAKRLAVHALKRDYGFDIPEDNSPRFKEVRFADGKAFLAFDNVRDWYVYSPDRSRAAPFEVAGSDGVWESAKIICFRQAKKNGKSVDTDYIDGSDIVVASEKVAAPVKVRYLGKNRTSGTLYNEASLPLGAFESK